MTAATMRTARKKKGVAARIVELAGNGIINAVLVVVAILWIVPTLGLFVTSLRPVGDSTSSGWWTIFGDLSRLTADNYISLLGNGAITGSLLNTVLIVVPSTLIVVLLGAFAGYAFAWINFPGRDWLLVVVIVLLAVPLQTALIPLARLFGAMGIFGSIFGVVLFHAAFGLPFAIFLLRNFFIQIPSELLEAARIDGASDFRAFWQVVLPLGAPALASLAIFQFLWTWNDLLVGLIFTSADTRPITVAIQSQLRTFGANIDVLSSGAFISMLLPLVVFFAFQRYFVQALLAGSQR